MKLVPLGDKIVLKQLEAEETTKSRNRNRVKIVRRQMITGKNKEMFNDGKGNQIRI